MVRSARSSMVAAALLASVGLLGPICPALADPAGAIDPEYSPSDAPIPADGANSILSGPIGEGTNTDGSGLDQAQPRFRMVDPSATDTAGNIAPKRVGEPRHNGIRGINGHATKEDFLWANLTASSPASGADPEIGNKAKHSFYDFRDGFDLPKYVAGPKVAK
jgi:hypothetical protein